MLPAVTLKVLPPAVAVLVTLVQLPPTVSGEAFTTPAGYVSVNCIPDSGSVPGFEIVKVMVLVPPGWIDEGENALAIVGLPSTKRLSVFEPGPCGSAFVVTPLAALGSVPITLLVITTVTVQPAAGMLIPVKLRLVWPAVSAEGVVPVQVPPTVWLAEIDMFTIVSRKAPPVCATPVGFDSV